VRSECDRLAVARCRRPLPIAARCAVLCLLAFLSGASPVSAQSNDPSPPHSLGACGGPMTGADGQTYPCAPDRKPACNEAGARCVCLEQRACGGTRDEPY
jgi:hypothetical protein